jgi:translation elongation factor EF-Tu-like GTPase
MPGYPIGMIVELVYPTAIQRKFCPTIRGGGHTVGIGVIYGLLDEFGYFQFIL